MKSIFLLALILGTAFGQQSTHSTKTASGGASHPNLLPKLVSTVDRHYNALETLKCGFTEHYIGNSIDRTESGTLLLKKPGRMRWDYQQPRPKLFLSDGKTAWFYLPGNRQARRSPAKDLEDLRSPSRYLLGKTKLEKELSGLAIAADVKPTEPGNVVLRGRPNGMADRVEDVLLEVNTAGQIVRLIIHEADGATTEFAFTNIEENVSISEAEFHFSAPPGVEVITSKDLAGPQ